MGKPLDKLKLDFDIPDVGRVLRRPAKPNRFALWIGKAVAFVLFDPQFRHLLPADVLGAQLAYLSRACNLNRLQRLFSDAGYRRWIGRMEAKTFPGLIAHIVLRKRRVEEVARAAIAGGIRQVVSFQAGFDTLLTRLAKEYPHVTCIEVDLPSTQKAKRAALKQQPANLHFVDLDLQEPYVEKVMLASGVFRAKEQTLFIAEGVLYFLDDDDVDRLFTFFQDNAGQRSQFVFTFLERGVDHRAIYPESSFWADFVLRLFRVHFGWGVRFEHLLRFLNDRYFALLWVETAQDLRRKAPAPIPYTAKPVRADSVALAELVFND